MSLQILTEGLLEDILVIAKRLKQKYVSQTTSLSLSGCTVVVESRADFKLLVIETVEVGKSLSITLTLNKNELTIELEDTTIAVTLGERPVVRYTANTLNVFQLLVDVLVQL